MHIFHCWHYIYSGTRIANTSNHGRFGEKEETRWHNISECCKCGKQEHLDGLYKPLTIKNCNCGHGE